MNLTDEAVSVIVAVVIIVLFGIGIFAFINVSNQGNDVENAKTLAGDLEASIERLSFDLNTEIVVQGIEEWYLTSYDSQDSVDDKPDKCFFKSCICISPSPTKESCQNEGIHRELDFEVVDVFEVRSYRENPNADCISGNQNPADVSRMNYLDIVRNPTDYEDFDYIRLDNALIDLQMTKISNSLFIGHEDRVIETDHLGINCQGSGGGV